jgi:hypothetical protein
MIIFPFLHRIFEFMHLRSLILFGVFLAALSACSKDSFTTSSDARIRLTSDTLHFDTVFTSAGSTTRAMKIVNLQNQKLRIDGIRLMGGSNSAFRINVDGSPGPQLNNLVLESGDSIYVFATVTVPPSGSNRLPFIVRDSLEIRYNGNTEWLQLEAWGQNARYLRNAVIRSNTSWDAQLPYVILGPLQVDSNVTLTLQPGTRVFCQADAPLLIDGTLLALGNAGPSERISFQGNRLDEPYRDFPASWPGIFFRNASKGNLIQYTEIRNAYQAIVLENGAQLAIPKLSMTKSVIHNSYDAGIYAIQSSLKADNCLISNCGKNLLMIYGGVYQLDHCTIASYGNAYLNHQEPVAFFANHAQINGISVTAPLQTLIRNCIFWGEGGLVDDEFVVSKLGNDPFNVSISHSLWKIKNLPSSVNAINMIANQPPQFDSIDNGKRFYDFRLQSSSPAKDKGLLLNYALDLDGKSRVIGLPDLGAYERQ